MPRIYTRLTPKEIIWRGSKRVPDGCLEWQGARDTEGYGIATYRPEPHVKRTMRVPRMAYEAFRGPIPEGMVVDHVVCDNPTCCDPWHLEPSTPGENVRRSPIAVAGVNSRKTHCPAGHPYSGDNLGLYRDAGGNVERYCRACRRQHDRRRRA